MIVPIVSKKSLSMIENVTSTAVTTPSRAITPKSRRPKVEKSGARTSARGSVAAPGVAGGRGAGGGLAQKAGGKQAKEGNEGPDAAAGAPLAPGGTGVERAL